MRRILGLGLLLTLAGMAGGEVPTTGPSVNDLLREIGSDDSGKATTAAQALAQLPGSSLAEIYAAATRADISTAGKQRLQAAIIAIHKRAAAERKKREDEIGKNWQIATGIEAYKREGQRDPKWDKLALAALTQNAEGQEEDSFAAFKAAVDAGCGDPLILYYYGLKGATSHQLSEEQYLNAMGRALENFGRYHYPPSRRLFALARFASYRLIDTEKLPAKDADLIRSNLGDALEMLRQLPADRIDEDSLLDIGTGLVTAYSWSLKNHKAAFDKVFGAMQAAYPNSAMPYAFATLSYVDWAWEARGSDWANKVTDQGWKLFGERLKVAADYGTKAWTTDPTNPRGPTEMLTVCLGQGEERSVMEMWFARAMLANPDNEGACNKKMTYLLPRWYGSAEDAVAFGRQCVANGNGRNHIPLVLVASYEGISDDKEWLQNPIIWQDFKDAFEKVLEDKTRLQDDRHRYLAERAVYLRWACDLKKWEDVRRLSKEFGNEIDMKVFGNKALYDYYMRKAAKELAKQPI